MGEIKPENTERKTETENVEAEAVDRMETGDPEADSEPVLSENEIEETEDTADLEKEEEEPADHQTEKNADRRMWDDEDDLKDEETLRDEERAYEERRNARKERILKRQRKRKRRMAAVGTFTVAAALFLCAYLYFGDTMTEQFAATGELILSKLDAFQRDETQNKKTQEASAGSETVKQDETAEVEKQDEAAEKQDEVQVIETVTPEPEELSAEDKKLYRRAKRYAQQYDYDRAIKTLKKSASYKSSETLQNAARKYKKKKDSCVSWPLEEVTHVFYHSLIVDTSRAFDDYKSGDYNQYMTTVDEFNKITQTMYDKGYVLVNLYDMASCDKNGNITRKEIMLPPGKIPFVLSQDDVCYYHYMEGDGLASKLIVDKDGKVRNEYVEADGSVSIGDYDVAPLLDRFVEKHPDFSYRGSKGILALTGYNGILGYRTDISYSTVPDDIDANKLEWLNAHPDFDFEKEKEEAKKVVQALKDEGWTFASHTWGHKNIQEVSMERLQTDTENFKANVDPLIGGTDIIIFAFGADLSQAEDYSGEKFEYLKSQGYNYYCNVDSQKYFVQIRDNYFRMGRRNLDGYRMYYNPELLDDLFDVSAVFDSARPVPVPQIGSGNE